MRNFILILLLVLIGLAFWPDRRNDDAEVEVITTSTTTTQLPKRRAPVSTTTTTAKYTTTTTLQDFETTTTYQQVETTLPPATYRTTTTTQELSRRQQRAQKAFELAQEKLKVPIEKELARAVPFRKWPRSEVLATGYYQAKAQIDGKEHVLRLNLLFQPDTGMIEPLTCAALFTREKVIFRESFRGTRLRLLNPPENGYFIISVLNKYNISIFRIGSGSVRLLQANLLLPGKAPLALQLEEIPGASQQDRCLQVY